jgi:ATP-dependent DNA helicase
LPDIFNDLEAFQEWFSVEDMDQTLSSEKASGIVHTLHGILKPFLLRRVKADVLSSDAWFEDQEADDSGKKRKDRQGTEVGLPPKKEYVLWAPLTVRQRELYDTILSGHLRTYLVNQATKPKIEDTQIELGPRKLRSKTAEDGGRKKKKRKYDVDGDDDEYFERLENGVEEGHESQAEEDLEEAARKHQLKTTSKRVPFPILCIDADDVCLQWRK